MPIGAIGRAWTWLNELGVKDPNRSYGELAGKVVHRVHRQVELMPTPSSSWAPMTLTSLQTMSTQILEPSTPPMQSLPTGTPAPDGTSFGIIVAGIVGSIALFGVGTFIGYRVVKHLYPETTDKDGNKIEVGVFE